MAMVTFKILVETELYEKCTEILAKNGLTFELAVGMFFEACVRCGDLPFPYTEQDIENAMREVARLEEETGQKALEVISDEPDST